MTADRVARERAAYDEGQVWQINDSWHRRFPHVFECPNTAKHEKLFRELVASRIPKANVLEIGCGFGDIAESLLRLNPASYLGIDVSEEAVAKASRLSSASADFCVFDIHKPIAGQFNLVFGQSVLHHIDFKEVLMRLYDQNLAPGGLLAFVEPLRGGLLIRSYWRWASGAHTPDEAPLSSKDISWMRSRFERFELLPFNYLSLTAGLVSSKLLKRPNNLATQLADGIDSRLAKYRALHPLFRRCLILISKPEQT